MSLHTICEPRVESDHIDCQGMQGGQTEKLGDEYLTRAQARQRPILRVPSPNYKAAPDETLAFLSARSGPDSVRALANSHIEKGPNASTAVTPRPSLICRLGHGPLSSRVYIIRSSTKLDDDIIATNFCQTRISDVLRLIGSVDSSVLSGNRRNVYRPSTSLASKIRGLETNQQTLSATTPTSNGMRFWADFLLWDFPVNRAGIYKDWHGSEFADQVLTFRLLDMGAPSLFFVAQVCSALLWWLTLDRSPRRGAILSFYETDSVFLALLACVLLFLDQQSNLEIKTPRLTPAGALPSIDSVSETLMQNSTEGRLTLGEATTTHNNVSGNSRNGFSPITATSKATTPGYAAETPLHFSGPRNMGRRASDLTNRQTNAIGVLSWRSLDEWTPSSRRLLTNFQRVLEKERPVPSRPYQLRSVIVNHFVGPACSLAVEIYEVFAVAQTDGKTRIDARSEKLVLRRLSRNQSNELPRARNLMGSKTEKKRSVSSSTDYSSEDDVSSDRTRHHSITNKLHKSATKMIMHSLGTGKKNSKRGVYGDRGCCLLGPHGFTETPIIDDASLQLRLVADYWDYAVMSAEDHGDGTSTAILDFSQINSRLWPAEKASIENLGVRHKVLVSGDFVAVFRQLGPDHTNTCKRCAQALGLGERYGEKSRTHHQQSVYEPSSGADLAKALRCVGSGSNCAALRHVRHRTGGGVFALFTGHTGLLNGGSEDNSSIFYTVKASDLDIPPAFEPYFSDACEIQLMFEPIDKMALRAVRDESCSQHFPTQSGSIRGSPLFMPAVFGLNSLLAKNVLESSVSGKLTARSLQSDRQTPSGPTTATSPRTGNTTYRRNEEKPNKSGFSGFIHWAKSTLTNSATDPDAHGSHPRTMSSDLTNSLYDSPADLATSAESVASVFCVPDFYKNLTDKRILKALAAYKQNRRKRHSHQTNLRLETARWIHGEIGRPGPDIYEFISRHRIPVNTEALSELISEKWRWDHAVAALKLAGNDNWGATQFLMQDGSLPGLMLPLGNFPKKLFDFETIRNTGCTSNTASTSRIKGKNFADEKVHLESQSPEIEQDVSENGDSQQLLELLAAAEPDEESIIEALDGRPDLYELQAQSSDRSSGLQSDQLSPTATFPQSADDFPLTRCVSSSSYVEDTESFERSHNRSNHKTKSAAARAGASFRKKLQLLERSLKIATSNLTTDEDGVLSSFRSPARSVRDISRSAAAAVFGLSSSAQSSNKGRHVRTILKTPRRKKTVNQFGVDPAYSQFRDTSNDIALSDGFPLCTSTSTSSGETFLAEPHEAAASNYVRELRHSQSKSLELLSERRRFGVRRNKPAAERDLISATDPRFALPRRAVYQDRTADAKRAGATSIERFLSARDLPKVHSQPISDEAHFPSTVGLSGLPNKRHQRRVLSLRNATEKLFRKTSDGQDALPPPESMKVTPPRTVAGDDFASLYEKINAWNVAVNETRHGRAVDTGKSEIRSALDTRGKYIIQQRHNRFPRDSEKHWNLISGLTPFTDDVDGTSPYDSLESNSLERVAPLTSSSSAADLRRSALELSFPVTPGSVTARDVTPIVPVERRRNSLGISRCQFSININAPSSIKLSPSRTTFLPPPSPARPSSTPAALILSDPSFNGDQSSTHVSVDVHKSATAQTFATENDDLNKDLSKNADPVSEMRPYPVPRLVSRFPGRPPGPCPGKVSSNEDLSPGVISRFPGMPPGLVPFSKLKTSSAEPSSSSMKQTPSYLVKRALKSSFPGSVPGLAPGKSIAAAVINYAARSTDLSGLGTSLPLPKSLIHFNEDVYSLIEVFEAMNNRDSPSSESTKVDLASSTQRLKLLKLVGRVLDQRANDQQNSEKPTESTGTKAAQPMVKKAPPPLTVPKPKIGPQGSLTRKEPAPKAPFGCRIFWKPLREKNIEGTIFAEIAGSSDPAFDAAPLAMEAIVDSSHLSRIFVKQKQDRPDQKSTSEAKPQGHVVLDAKRAHNVSIILARLKYAPVDAVALIENADVSSLSVEELDKISAMVPLEEEAKAFDAFFANGGEPEGLRSIPEQKIFPLCPSRCFRLPQTIEVLKHQKTWRDRVRSLRRDLLLLRQATAEVRSSNRLRQVLQVVLRWGNFVNHGVAAGELAVRGFTLGSLLKLTEFKTTVDPSITSLHYLTANMLHSAPGFELHLIGKDMPSVPEAAKLSTEALMLSLGDLERNLTGLKAEVAATLEKQKEDPERFTARLERLQEFERAESMEVQIISKLFEEIGLEVYAAGRFFGDESAHQSSGPRNNFKMEALFITLKEFLKKFVECCKDVKTRPKKYAILLAAAAVSSEQVTAVTAPRAVPIRSKSSSNPLHRNSAGRESKELVRAKTIGLPREDFSAATVQHTAEVKEDDIEMSKERKRGSIGPRRSVTLRLSPIETDIIKSSSQFSQMSTQPPPEDVSDKKLLPAASGQSEDLSQKKTKSELINQLNRPTDLLSQSTVLSSKSVSPQEEHTLASPPKKPLHRVLTTGGLTAHRGLQPEENKVRSPQLSKESPVFGRCRSREEQFMKPPSTESVGPHSSNNTFKSFQTAPQSTVAFESARKLYGLSAIRTAKSDALLPVLKAVECPSNNENTSTEGVSDAPRPRRHSRSDVLGIFESALEQMGTRSKRRSSLGAELSQFTPDILYEPNV